MQQDASRDEILFSFDENQKVFGVQYNTYKYFVNMIEIGFTLTGRLPNLVASDRWWWRYH